MKTPSDHAQGDLRVEDVKISADFIEALNSYEAPLPWDVNDTQIVDAKGCVVCDVDGHQMIAEMIVLAVNTCGSFRATRRDDKGACNCSQEDVHNYGPCDANCRCHISNPV